MKLSRIFLLSCLILSLLTLLSGCNSFSNNNTTAHKTTYQKVNKKYTRKRKNRYASSLSSSTQISLNDFTDLNLNNVAISNDDSNNLWKKIAAGLKLPDASNRPEVQEQIQWFIHHPSYLERTTERARPYLYIVYQEVKSRNLPTELVLLPINESAYYPFSYSSTGATGIWQLMPGTASDWGLKHDFWYDGRRDIFDSTNAALDYLTYLAHYFNDDWLLAIAAYDTGEGNVQKAIVHNQREGLPTNFWALRLSAETRSYVPRLLALASIIAHPDRYPVVLPPVDAKAVVEAVHVDHPIKLTDAANLAGISLNQLKVLNPGLSRTTTDPDSDSKLLVPVESAANFKANLNNIAQANIGGTNNFSHYRVQRGDSLESIANRFNIPIEDLRQANNLFRRHLKRGQVLLIPNVADTYKPNTQINLDQTSLNLKSNNFHHQKESFNTENSTEKTKELDDEDDTKSDHQKTADTPKIIKKSAHNHARSHNNKSHNAHPTNTSHTLDHKKPSVLHKKHTVSHTKKHTAVVS